MGQAVLAGDPPIEITLRRSARARRLSLRISQLDGRVTLTLPPHVPQSDGLAFAEEKQSWIRRSLERQPETVHVQDGTVVPLEGWEVTVVADRRRSASLQGDQLFVPQHRIAVSTRVFLKERARERLLVASETYAARLGKAVGKITLRDTRSRWGSCSSQGHLMYSWRLILTPPEVLNYVAAHEVAHLEHMDHSRAFWACVEGLCPDWRSQRDWLRQNGSALHRFRFDN